MEVLFSSQDTGGEQVRQIVHGARVEQVGEQFRVVFQNDAGFERSIILDNDPRNGVVYNAEACMVNE